MEVGEEGDYIPIATLSPPEWLLHGGGGGGGAAMRAILMFRNCKGESHKTVSTDHNFWSERRAEADSNRDPSVYQPNALPLRQTGLLLRERAESSFIDLQDTSRSDKVNFLPLRK